MPSRNMSKFAFDNASCLSAFNNAVGSRCGIRAPQYLTTRACHTLTREDDAVDLLFVTARGTISHIMKLRPNLR
jgi:hypothetical protein